MISRKCSRPVTSPVTRPTTLWGRLAAMLSFQHLLKPGRDPYYTSGELEGYLRDYSPRQGTPRLPREAYVGVFDGTTNYATLGRRLTSGSPTGLSCTAWVKTTALSVFAVGEYFTTGDNRSWLLGVNSIGTTRVYISPDGTSASSRKEYNGTTVINDGEWHCIGFSFSDSVLIVYVDGQVETVTKIADGAISAIYNSTAYFAIGASNVNASANLNFPGSLSDVRIYDSAKTADEIAAIYAGDHLNPDTTGLLAAYALEEESGTLLYDWSGNGNDLTVAGTMTNFWDTDADKSWSYVDSRGHSPVGPNLLLYSEVNANPAWTSLTGSQTISTDFSIAPDGTMTADRITFAADGSTRSQIFSTSVAVGDVYTGSVWVRNTTPGILFRIARAYGGTYEQTSYTIPVSSEWQRIEVTHTFQYVQSGVRFDFNNNNAGNDATIEVWGAQLQTGTVATDYSKTTATANPDVAIKPKIIGQSSTYTGRTTYPGLSYVSTLQGDGSTVYVDCGATTGLVDNVKFWFYTGTTINSASAGRGLFCHNYTGGSHDLGLGSVTGYSDNEVISLLYSTGRTMVVNITIAPGWHTLELDWNGSHYDIILDDVVQTVTIGTAASHAAQFEMDQLRFFIRYPLTGYSDGQIANFQFTVADGTTYTIVPERTGDRIWKMGTDGSAVLVDSAIAGTLTNVHQSAELPVEDWHLKHGGHVGSNTMIRSEEFDNAQWTKLGVGNGLAPVVTANATVSPDGATTADRIVFDAVDSAGQSQIYNVSGTNLTGICTFSVWLKAETGTPTVYLRIDWSGDSFSVNAVLTNEWQRYSVTMPSSESSATVVNRGTIGTRPLIGTSTTATVFAWGAQLNTGTEALPYTPATASSATDVHVPASYNNVAPDGEAPYYAPGVLMETRKLAPRGGVDSVFANTVNLESVYTFGNERASIDPIDTKRKVVLEPIGERDFVAYKDAIPLSGSFIEENLTLNHQYTRDDYAVVGPELTFSRASGAMMFNSDGTLVWAPENLLPYSEDLSNAEWVKILSTIETDAIESPDGRLVADKVVDDLTSGQHGVRNPTYSLVPGAYTVKVYVKAAGRNYAYIWVDNASGSGMTYLLDLTTGIGSFTRTNVVQYSNTSVEVTNAGNGWWGVAITTTTTYTSVELRVYPGETGIVGAGAYGTESYLGDGSSGVYIWGAQLYRSPNASSAYIPTTSAAVYGERINSHVYEGGAWVNKGLLIEGQATNLLTYSEQFDNAAWSKNRMTVTSDSIIAPDGTLSADLFTASSNDANGYNFNSSAQTIAISAASPVTCSVYLKKGNLTHAIILVYDGTANGVRQWVNLTTGDIGTSSVFGTGWAKSAASATDVGNGWWRVSLSVTTTGTLADVVVYPSTSADGAFNCTLGDTGYVWGIQLETGSISTSYIPTTSAAVTRSADVATIGGADFSSFYNQSEGTWVVESDLPQVEVGAIMYATSGNVNESLRVGTSTSGNIWVYSRSAGVTDGTVNSGAYATGLNKTSISYGLNDLRVSRNGLAVVSDSSLASPVGISELRAGIGHTGVALNGNIASLKYYSTRKPNAFLKGITTPAYDVDALNYFTRAEALGGSFDQSAINSAYSEIANKTAISNFIAGCKDDNIWHKLTEVYLLAGVTFGGLMAKLKYASVTTLTNNNFVTGDYLAAGSGAGLIGNGSSKYIDTSLVDSTLNAESKSLSLYITQFGGTDNRTHLGTQGEGWWGSSTSTDIQFRMSHLAGGVVTCSASGSTAYAIGTRRGVNDVEGYINGISAAVDVSTIAATNDAHSWYLFNRNNAGTPNASTYSDSRLSFAHVGTGLTDTDAANLSIRVNALMTALGTNVY